MKIKLYVKMLSFIILACMFINCQNKQTTTLEDDKQAVKQTLISMWSAIEKDDIDTYAAYIHPDFTQFGETDPVLRIGKKAEVAGIASWLENSSDIHTDMLEPRITVNGNTAWIVYYWSDRGFTEGVEFTSRGKSTRIFVKENGKWLCIHGHYTLLP